MKIEKRLQRTISSLEEKTGIVIPVHFPPDTAPEAGIAILQETVHHYSREISNPQNICLSVDGPGPAVAIAEYVASDYDTRVVLGNRNRGKLAAVQNGIRTLLKLPGLHYLATVDQDGDHFANELLNLLRAAEHIAQTMDTDRILVLGERLSRHRPLGFLRGEQEELANQMLMDALYYDAAICGQPLRLTFCSTRNSLPDFHSGYKLFSRQTAELVFSGEPNLAGCSEEACYRHACEAVMSVEAIKHGAALASVNRSTLDGQPISNFARFDRSQLAADMIIWPCKRLGVPGHFVAQWLENHLPRLQLSTLIPLGLDELLAIRALVLEAFDCPLPPDQANELPRPRFL